MPGHRIFTTPFAKVYPLYVQKAERKNRTRDEVDRVICWLTGYSAAGLQEQLQKENDIETFFAEAPAMNPNASGPIPRSLFIVRAAKPIFTRSR